MIQPGTLASPSEEFSRWVSEALDELYDSVALQTHPLGLVLFPEESNNLRRCQCLRKALLNAIQALEPACSTPVTSPDRRLFRLLGLRFIEGLNPSEVMAQIGLAKSQYYRDQARGENAIRDIVWARYWENKSASSSACSSQLPVRSNLVQSEVERLLVHRPTVGIDSSALVAYLRGIIAPLSQDREVALELGDLNELDGLLLDRVALQQALLSAFVALLDLPDVQRVEVAGSGFGNGKAVNLKAVPAPSEALPVDKLEACRLLLEAMGGKLSIERVGKALNLRMTWPFVKLHTLLVIDDNAGMTDLFRIYLRGLSWEIFTANDGVAASAALKTAHPSVVLLDILMPNMDGWEFLKAIKADPLSRDIPVIICSVLRQPQVALKLGAAAYLEKPVLQETLLKALAAWS